MHQVGSAVLVGAHAGSLRSRLLAPRGYLVRREIEEIDLVGDGAEVESRLAGALASATPGSTVLVHVSGSVDVRQDGDVLSTRPSRSERTVAGPNTHPRAVPAMRLRRIVGEYLATCPAGIVVLIADTNAPASWISEVRNLDGDRCGHPKIVELVTYRDDVPGDIEPGPLTDRVIDALETSDDGLAVTVQRLVHRMGSEFASIRVGTHDASETTADADPRLLPAPHRRSRIEFGLLDHPMREALGLLRELIGSAPPQSVDKPADALTAALQRLDDARTCGLWSSADGTWRFESLRHRDGESVNDHRTRATARLGPAFERLDQMGRTTPALLIPEHRGDDPDRVSLAIRVGCSRLDGIVLLEDVDPRSVLLSSQISAAVIGVAVSSARSASTLDDVESAVVDHLRATCGRVPDEWYERRFRAFERSVARISMSYQPIVRCAVQRAEPGLSVIQPSIAGWEALARYRHATDATPASAGAVFSAAELWGDRFIERLDGHLLPKAVESFKQQCTDLGITEPIDLHVNCYPQSIFRPEFIDTLRWVTRDAFPASIVLEISEKASMPAPRQFRSDDRPVDTDEAVGVRAFHDHVARLRPEINFHLAIDDFGVGHSSPVRLSGIPWKHIKVDRAVLVGPHPVQTLTYAVAVAKADLKDATVVVEGWDDEADVRLGTILDANVHHIQGNRIAGPAPEIYIELPSTTIDLLRSEPLPTR